MPIITIELNSGTKAYNYCEIATSDSMVSLQKYFINPVL